MSNDIDDLFSDKMENEIKNEIKKKRSKLNLKLVVISIVSTLIIVILGSCAINFMSNRYIENSFSKERKSQELEYVVMHPNEYIGKESCIQIGYFKYESNYDIGKRIGSRVLYAGSSTNILNGIGRNKAINKESRMLTNIPLSDDINTRYSNVYGLRNLYFLYPYVHYGSNIYEYETDKNKLKDNDLANSKENTINDFDFLNQIDDNKTVEMALSFNKEYNYDDVNRMIDSNLITFYWVDNNSEEEKEHIIEMNDPAFSVVGIKSIDGAGEFRKDVNSRIENFKAAIKQLRDIGNTQYTQNIDENNIKVIGAVVVGSPRELKELQNNPIIKHAVIGSVVDKY